MTTVELEQAIEAVLGVVPFQPPVTLDYCAAVYRELSKTLGNATSIDVMHRYSDLIVEARVGNTVARLILPLV